ncbi:MAG: ankyrin repeat domain-containing protein, partial [Cellulomonas sp.]|nr:ankyrin repeat domain-containing protein [Rickettsiella sp.]
MDQLNQEKEPIFCFLTREHFSNLALWVWESKENFQSEINQVNFEGDTALHIAARYGYLDMVDFLLTHQANFKLRNHDNYTPMDEAVSESQLSVIKKLYETGASLVPTDYQQNVPSILAIEENAIEIINYFFSKNIPVVKNQANEISYDSQGETALHAICSVGDKALFELILSYPETDQTYINYANYKGQSALHFAAKYDQYDFLKQLSAKRGNIFLKDKNEKVPLHYLDFSKQETFIFIKSLSVEINEQLKDETNNSLLHFAAEAGNLDLVRYLVEEKKFIIYLVNDRGYSPLSTAVVERQTLVVDYLVNKIDMEKKWDKFIREDGDIFSFLQDENGNTLAHLAVIYDQPLLLQKLVEKQPTIVRLRNNNLENLFDLAVTFGKKALVSNLIKLNNDIIHGYEENTPLYIACREGHLDIVKLLVESGVDINKPGFMKNSPLMGAVKAKSISVIDYLLTRNPDVQKTNILGESFFSLLKKTGDPFLIEKFITKFLSLPLAQIGLEDTSTLSEHWPAFSANFRQMMCSLLPQPRNKRATNCEKIKENERWYRPLTPLATEWPGESAHFFSLLSLAFGIVFPNEFKVENQIYDKSHWLAYQ